MNPRTLFWTYTLTGLTLAGLPTPASAGTPPAAPIRVADTPAVIAVKQFLADRAAGQYDAAYALISPASRQGLTEKEFAAGNPSPFGNDQMFSASLMSVGGLFVDTHNASGYTFTVVGPDPADPAVVLIQASRPPAPAMTLRLLTAIDPATHTPRLDLIGSLERTDPKQFALGRKNAERAVSLSNLRQIALGIIQYTQDHEEKMPDADKWIDEIMPYVKTEAIFRDPSAPVNEKWSYAYNRSLSHQPLARFDAPAVTVMLFESAAGIKNAADTGESVPRPGRHSGGTDYALADGHVKWMRDGTKVSFRLDGN